MLKRRRETKERNPKICNLRVPSEGERERDEIFKEL